MKTARYEHIISVFKVSHFAVHLWNHPVFLDVNFLYSDTNLNHITAIKTQIANRLTLPTVPSFCVSFGVSCQRMKKYFGRAEIYQDSSFEVDDQLDTFILDR